MRKILLFTVLLIVMTFNSANAQVGIGTSTPNASAMLDINSTNKGMLFPSYNMASLTDPTTPVLNPTNGLMVYNNGGIYEKGLYYWYVDSWNKLFVNTDVSKTMILSTIANTTPNPSGYVGTRICNTNKSSLQ